MYLVLGKWLKMTKNLYHFLYVFFHFFKSYLNVVLKIGDELNL